MKRFASLRVCLVALFLFSASHCELAIAQDEKSAPAAETPALKVYYLRHIDSKIAYEVASTMLADSLSRIAVDSRSNSLVVSANEVGHDAFADVLKVLDKPPIPLEELKIISAGNLDVSILSRMVPNIEVAQSGDQIILKGDRDGLLVAEALAQRLVETTEEKNALPKGLMVEVQWLTEAGEKAFQLKGELADKLAARGFGPLSILAALETRVSPNGEFASESGQGAMMLKVNGVLSRADSGLEIALETSAMRDPLVLEFESTFFAEPNRWLVFGVAQGSELVQNKQPRSLILVRVKEDSPL